MLSLLGLELNKGKILNNLDFLEAQSIDIFREAIAAAKNPVMLYSIGKDSSVLLKIAQKAFAPAPIPFPLLHVDTLWKFREMYNFRDGLVKNEGVELKVYTNPRAIEENINPFKDGSSVHTQITKTDALKQVLDLHKYDFIFGGARRDEEKSRAKERIFSFRTNKHRWNPKKQQPELWSIYNTYLNSNENVRVFPLSNWTELDVWQYIYRENIPIVPLYFAKERPTVTRENMILMVDDERFQLDPDEKIQIKKIRFRSLGCYPLTGGVESTADTLEKVILEIANSNFSERQTRKIDSDNGQSMEEKKKDGYF